jgi:hypothetical protein
MKKDLIVNSLIVMFVGVVVVAAVVSAATQDITASVRGENVSVTVTDASVDFGILGASTTKTTNQLSPDDTQFVVNTGNVASVFNVKATSSQPGWDITTDGVLNADNEFDFKWATDGGTLWTRFGYDYGVLATGVAALATTNTDLQIITPTTITDYASQSITVTVQVTTP